MSKQPIGFGASVKDQTMKSTFVAMKPNLSSNSSSLGGLSISSSGSDGLLPSSGVLSPPSSSSTHLSEMGTYGGQHIQLSQQLQHQLEQKQQQIQKLEEQERVQAIQKLQFHDFPLTTATLSKYSGSNLQVAQAKILSDKQVQPPGQSIHRSLLLSSSAGPTSTSASSVVTFTSVPHPGIPSPQPQLPATVTGQTPPPLASSTLNLAVSKDVKFPEKLGESKLQLSTEESLGRVPSIMEPPKVVLKDIIKTLSPSVMSQSGAKPVTVNLSTITSPSVSSASPTGSSPAVKTPTSSANRAPKGSVTTSSYTPTAKPVLPTVASTRTRRIRTPKQYDL